MALGGYSKLAENDELVLRFGSVTHNAKIYVNGRELASHKGGFTPFEVIIRRDLYQRKSNKNLCLCQ